MSELILLDLDSFMLQFRRFQTREDWEIEKRCKSTRLSSYVWALAVFIVGRSATMTDEFILSKIDPYTTTEASMKRGLWWKAGRLPRSTVESLRPRGLIAQYYNLVLGMKRLPVRHGLLNFACGAVPAYITFALMNHSAQNRRLNSYLKQDTVFGEMARTLTRGATLRDASVQVLTRVDKEFLKK
eukprot:RCo022242